VPECKRPGFFGALPITGTDYRSNGFVLPVPAIPSGFATSTLTATGLTVSWSGATDNVAVTGYEIFRNGITASTTITLSSVLTRLPPHSRRRHCPLEPRRPVTVRLSTPAPHPRRQ